MKEYRCSWSKLPENLKTKTSLTRMGIYQTGPVVAKITHYNKSYDLYDVNYGLKLEKQRGNKSISISSENKNDYVILEMVTTGDTSADEIVQLVMLSMDGELLFNQYFNPKKELSSKVQQRSRLNKFYLKQQPIWSEKWNEIQEYIKNKVLLIPDTSYGVRLLKQTCEKYSTEIDFQLNAICSRDIIQHKFSFLSLFELTPKQIQNPLKDCFEALKILYPKSQLFSMQALAKNYFDKMCNYKITQGDKGAYQQGYNWLQTSFKLSSDELNFENVPLNICNKVISELEPSLKCLGLIK